MTDEQLEYLILQLTDGQKTELVNQLTSDQYIDNVNTLMDMQNNQTAIWLGITALFLGGIALLQWWYNARESKNIERRAQDKVMKEINDKLHIDDLTELRMSFENYDKVLHRMIDHSELLLNILENSSDIRILFADVTFATICVNSIKNGFFFKSFLTYLPIMMHADGVNYAKIFERFFNQLSISYPIDKEEMLAIEELLRIFTEIIESESSHTLISKDEFVRMVSALESIKTKEN